MTDIDYDTPAVIPDSWDDPNIRARLNWHLRMAHKLGQERDAETSVYRSEIARLQAELAELEERYDRRIAWHTAPVKSWHVAMVSADNDASRTVQFPHGVSKVRVAKTPRVSIDDRDALIGWLSEHYPSAVTWKPSVTVAQVKDVCEVQGESMVNPVTGEVVPGVSAHVPDPSVSITFPTTDDAS